MRSIPICLILAALLSFSGCTVYPERPVRAFNQATGGEGFERAFWKEVQAQDWQDVGSHLASNFMYVTPRSRWERAAAFDHIQSLRIQDYAISDMSTEMNRDTFVVSYTIVLRGTSPAGELPTAPERRMTVWQQQKKGWMAIAHSVLGPVPQ